MFKIKGLDEFQKKLDSLANNLAELDGRHQVPVTELLTPSFLSKHTSFSSADELFTKSGFKIESPEDFEVIPDDEWDTYIRSISSFDSWEELLSKAAEEWAVQKIGL